jgi:branched-subunit amino acid aminotransferase/4-amino-4-deoxychorismate lyase
MAEPQAYWNGRFVPASQATVPLDDAGFMLGATVAEQLRTFGGRLFRLDAHLTRLYHSLEIVGVDPGLTHAELGLIAEELAATNGAMLAPGDDLGLAIFVTPGSYANLGPKSIKRPLVCVHTRTLPFAQWSDKYATGEALSTTDVRQIPANCWPPELKCRSRMHYYLADRQAQAKDPDSRALLCDDQGFVVEASTANIIVYRSGEGLLAPPWSKVLPGVSLATVADLAPQLGLKLQERDLTPADVASSDEVFLTSTSPCIVPVTRLDGRPIGSGKPGDVFRRLIGSWSSLVGVDIVDQAQRFAKR